MKTSSQVSTEKLRGGFYSPDSLVDRCLDRATELLGDRSGLRLLEPSAGDGAFLRGLGRHDRLRQSVQQVTAIELIPSEAAHCRAEVAEMRADGTVRVESAVSWAATTEEKFDCAVGNPPYVRFQFLTAADKQQIPAVATRAGVSFKGVSNLWLPVLLGSLSRLEIGGAFAFIVPTECFTGISAGALRRWLTRDVDDLRFDLFPAKSFPGVLQEVTILSGVRRQPSQHGTRCEIREHSKCGDVRTAVHHIPPGGAPWTRYLLTTAQLAAFEEASDLAAVSSLGDVARFGVAAVTGANGFFSVDEATAQSYALDAWCRPLLPRIRHAAGLRYSQCDHDSTVRSGARAFLLDFSADAPDPDVHDGPSEYLETGVKAGLPERYKCRIREPWYRVPHIRSERLMLSKRSHLYPRVVLNEAEVVTTDTIYRGSMLPAHVGREEDLVAAFHNSLTLLSAEIEGRSFGGGVLELVPSEVGRLVVAMPQGFAAELERLDELARGVGADVDEGRLVDETDLLLQKADIGLSPDLMDTLAAARQSLLNRRLDRNRSDSDRG